jgi:hypothetical protein
VTFATSQVLPPRVCAFAVLRMVVTRTMASNLPKDIADMSALIATLLKRLVDLEATNLTSVGMPPTRATRDSPFKVDLCLFNGEKPLQAREFHRLAKLIPDMSPGMSEDT